MNKDLVILINIDRGRTWAAVKNEPAPHVRVVEFNIDTGTIRRIPNYLDKNFVEAMDIIANHDEAKNPMKILPSLCKKCLNHVKQCITTKHQL